MPTTTLTRRLTIDRAVLAAQLAEMDAAIAVLGRYEPATGRKGNGKGNGRVAAAALLPVGPSRPALTPARRKAISIRMRAYWKARRAAEAKGKRS